MIGNSQDRCHPHSGNSYARKGISQSCEVHPTEATFLSFQTYDSFKFTFADFRPGAALGTNPAIRQLKPSVLTPFSNLIE